MKKPANLLGVGMWATTLRSFLWDIKHSTHPSNTHLFLNPCTHMTQIPECTNKAIGFDFLMVLKAHFQRTCAYFLMCYINMRWKESERDSMAFWVGFWGTSVCVHSGLFLTYVLYKNCPAEGHQQYLRSAFCFLEMVSSQEGHIADDLMPVIIKI